MTANNIRGWARALCLIAVFIPTVVGADTFVRFRLETDDRSPFAVGLAGTIHKTPWYLPKARFPVHKGERFPGGEFTPWLDLGKWAGDRMHGQMKRSGGVAEFPYVTVQFELDPLPERLTATIELADRPDPKAVKKRWREPAPPCLADPPQSSAAAAVPSAGPAAAGTRAGAAA